MANWITLTIDELKASEHGAIVDAAQATATGSAPDPVARTITDVTARIRAMISPGNLLDADTTKIPKSLVDLGARMCIRSLKARLLMDLSQDERDTRKEDNDYLKFLQQEQTAFEQPDTLSNVGQAEMQQTGDLIEQTTGTTIDPTLNNTNSQFPAVPMNRQSLNGLT